MQSWSSAGNVSGELITRAVRKVRSNNAMHMNNVMMWTRDHYFPITYAHATWAQLAPFFQLRGVVVWARHTISVELHPFNDRQYNRDLMALCQRVNERQVRLPDGRLLVFSVMETHRPILHGQKRLIA